MISTHEVQTALICTLQADLNPDFLDHAGIRCQQIYNLLRQAIGTG